METRSAGVETERADLHMHSDHSDGLHSPTRLVELARDAGLCAISLTDHDTVSGVEEFLAASLEAGVEGIPGVELSTNYRGCDLHLLGYFIDHREPHFVGALADFRMEREHRAERIVGRLRELGLEVDWEEVQRQGGGGALGRPHIARTLVVQGFVSDPEEAFQRWLGVGRPGYVEKYKLDTLEALRLVKEAGGVTILAHPGTATERGLVDEVIEAGVEGLEIYHPRNSGADVVWLEGLADRHGLLRTGGTDFHGDPTRPGEADLGERWIPMESVGALREKAGSRVA